MVHFKVPDPELGWTFFYPNKNQAKAILNRDYLKALSLGISLDLYLDCIKSPPIIM